MKKSSAPLQILVFLITVLSIGFVIMLDRQGIGLPQPRRLLPVQITDQTATNIPTTFPGMVAASTPTNHLSSDPSFSMIPLTSHWESGNLRLSSLSIDYSSSELSKLSEDEFKHFMISRYSAFDNINIQIKKIHLIRDKNALLIEISDESVEDFESISGSQLSNFGIRLLIDTFAYFNKPSQCSSYVFYKFYNPSLPDKYYDDDFFAIDELESTQLGYRILRFFVTAGVNENGYFVRTWTSPSLLLKYSRASP